MKAKVMQLQVSNQVSFVRVFDNTELADDLDKRSQASAKMVEYWNKTDALIDGHKAIINGGKTFLPEFPDEDEKDYEFRSSMTKFTNIFRDICEGLASKPFEKPVKFSNEENVSKEIKEIAENVDGRGNNLTAFAGQVFFNGIVSAVHWVVVDYPKKDDDVVTIADQKKKNIKPYWYHVLGRNVLEAKSEIIGGKEVLTRFRFLEPGTPEKVRIFEKSENDNVSWSLWEKSEQSTPTQSKWKKIDGGELTIDEIPAVPFATGRRDGSEHCYFPAMVDAADLQVELYQQESGLKYAKIMVAYPMLSGNGVKPPKDSNNNPLPLKTGPRNVLYAPADAAGNVGSWAYVEPSAQSLKFLAEEIKETKQDLRELGRQPLTAQSGNLTVITTAVAAGKAKSAVGAWGLNLKNSLENLLEITKKWIEDNKSEITVDVYDDYDDFSSEETHLNALHEMRKNRDLSQKTYWSSMRKRNVLADDFDGEEETKHLLLETPNEDFGDDDKDEDAEI